MLLVDDVLCFPFKSLLLVFREIYNAAVQEQEQEGDQIRLELSELYHSLETGAIDEATFDDRERDLLDRLDALEAKQAEMESDGENSSGELEPEMDEQDLDGYDDATRMSGLTSISPLRIRNHERRSDPSLDLITCRTKKAHGSRNGHSEACPTVEPSHTLEE